MIPLFVDFYNRLIRQIALSQSPITESKIALAAAAAASGAAAAPTARRPKTWRDFYRLWGNRWENFSICNLPQKHLKQFNDSSFSTGDTGCSWTVRSESVCIENKGEQKRNNKDVPFSYEKPFLTPSAAAAVAVANPYYSCRISPRTRHDIGREYNCRLFMVVHDFD